jgi:two-component system response regulator AtoC
VSTEVERQLVSANWEGNVRELRNTIERACILARGAVISESDLVEGGAPNRRVTLMQASSSTAATTAAAASVASPDGPRLLSLVERDHVLHVLQQTGGNKKAAAKILGISRRSLYRLLEQHGAAN